MFQHRMSDQVAKSVEMTLDMKMEDIEDQQEFEDRLCKEVAESVGGNPSSIKVKALRAGSVIVDFEIQEGKP